MWQHNAKHWHKRSACVQWTESFLRATLEMFRSISLLKRLCLCWKRLLKSNPAWEIFSRVKCLSRSQRNTWSLAWYLSPNAMTWMSQINRYKSTCLDTDVSSILSVVVQVLPLQSCLWRAQFTLYLPAHSSGMIPVHPRASVHTPVNQWESTRRLPELSHVDTEHDTR